MSRGGGGVKLPPGRFYPRIFGTEDDTMVRYDGPATKRCIHWSSLHCQLQIQNGEFDEAYFF